MEPNLLNPLSAVGRKLFPMEAHTKGEKQFTPESLRKILSLADFSVRRYVGLFFFAFPVARLLKIAGIKLHPSLVKMIYLLESFLEIVPGVRYLNSTIVAVGTTSK